MKLSREINKLTIPSKFQLPSLAVDFLFTMYMYLLLLPSPSYSKAVHSIYFPAQFIHVSLIPYYTIPSSQLLPSHSHNLFILSISCPIYSCVPHPLHYPSSYHSSIAIYAWNSTSIKIWLKQNYSLLMNNSFLCCDM